MTTPQAQADRLTNALQDNTRALSSVRRRFRWSLIVTALLAFVLAYVVYTNHQSNIETCENGNEVRSEIDDKFGSIAEFLDVAISDTPENKQFIELVEQRLVRRDCSEIGWIT